MSKEEMKAVDIRTVGADEVLSREEIDRTARINMEVCAAFVARMIQKYGQEVLAEIEELKAKENTDEQ